MVAATDQTSCLALAQRQVGDTDDWTPVQWLQQLQDDSLTINGAIYFRPYRTALAYLSRPDRVKARSEGDVSERYADDTATLALFRERDQEWATTHLPTSQGEWSGAIEWGSW